MSRVGKKPIYLPEGVEVTLAPPSVTVKGPNGTLTTQINEIVTIKQEEVDGKKAIVATIPDETNVGQNAQWGTARAVINNLVEGVTNGFKKSLEVVGVGYRVSASGDTIVLNVGYSHEVKYQLPEGIKADVEKNTITLSGASKQVLGQVAAEIRKIRKPEPYKGKGIKYVDEVIRRKVGKAAKAGE